ncbi:beta-N-acetylglucosaminidase domain-containing protein [uncultured Allobaculum sp.]|uniref:beta-N-acetylglucosaminidase domain-containing protein n=1 Tax=uncultured Allobaculum sp. TaxID=1187017 RepID=UPI002595F577|nr:beta-N-acetylglucosaminidase domain-containing protein [uncultured Allobaculum sp.]
MRKASRKIASSFLAAAMLIPSFSLPAAAAEPQEEPVASTEYKIYPTPHSVVYATGTTTISNDVNVVYSAGIDQYTKDHAADVFKLLGEDVKLTTSDAAVEGKTNLLVGIQGEDSPAKTYFDTHTITAEDLFSKTDSYALEIQDGTIAILGVSTDAAFYGLTSLKHIFKQVENKEVRNLRMEDFADVKTRGFIEGYYGNPWSFEDRADLMTFGGDYKLNGYFYAPKDDPKHNAKWRELYTEEELKNHAMLAEAGNKSKCYYIYALHPFMTNAISFGSNYQSDLKIIKDKFEQMMGVGVKQFAILADDAGVPGGEPQNYVTLMTDLTNWLKTKQSEYPGLKTDMIFCPNDYMGNGSSQQMQTLKQLPDSVSIIETGGRVWGEVGPSFNNRFYSNMGRPAFMWINWPCSDNTKDSLIMGAALTFLKPNTNPETVNGIVLNPMQQSEPSKEAIFTNADYAWNIWTSEEKYDSVWHDSFNYIDHGDSTDTIGSAAYRELSKHMQYSRAVNTEESVEIKDAMSALGNKLAAGDATVVDDVKALRPEFEKLHQAALDYREYTGNERTLGQITYWIDAWEDTTDAILGYFDTIDKLESGAPLSEIWDSFSAAQAARDQSETHKLWYIDHWEYAKAGTKYVTPFMNRLDTLLSDQILPLVDPSADRVHIITNRIDTPTGSMANATDGNPNTEIIYKTPSKVEPGDYIGVMRTTPIDVDSVSILLGQSGNLNDTFPSAKLQYTQDGVNWIDIGEETSSTTDMSQTGLGLKNVLGMRVLCTGSNPNIWLGVRDFVLNPEAGGDSGETGEGSFSLPAGNGAYQTNTKEKAYDGDASTYLWTNQKAAVGDTFTWTYGEEVRARNVHIIMGNGSSADKWTSFVLETSVDGTNWTEHKTFTSTPKGADEYNFDLQNASVKYVRLRNLEAVENWVQLSEFTVETEAGDPYNASHLMTNTDIEAGVFFTAAESKLKAEGSITLQPGEYLGMDLERIVEMESIDPGTDAAGLSVQTSRNDYEWQAFDAKDPIGRYVRLINNTDQPVTFTIDDVMTVTCKTEAVIKLDSSTMGKDDEYGYQDTRNNGAAFDGDVDTTTLFADYPKAGQNIIYDLGQLRPVSKVTIYTQDSATNYLTDFKVSVSADKGNWTEVFTISDGQPDTNELTVNAVNSELFTASSTYPNKVMASGEITSTNARYVKIEFTADNDVRFAGFNEIEINDGAYVPVYNAAFRTDSAQREDYIPANLVDGSLATAWTPDTDAAGFIEYDYSEGLEKNHFNVITKGDASKAAFSVLGVKDGEKKWYDLGTLDHSLSQFAVDIDKVLTVKISWPEGTQPVVSEIIAYKASLEEIDTTLLKAAIDKGEGLTLSDFNEASQSALGAGLDSAKAAYRNKRSQEAVDAAAKSLNDVLLEARKTPSASALEEI